MTADPVSRLTPDARFRAFKYLIYALLAINIFLFFQEDYLAARETFGDTIGWGNFVEAYSSTIDTAAWVVLLLLFELETAVIPDEKLRGGLKWPLTAVRAVCYVFIVWAFWGYWVQLGLVSGLEPFAAADPCSLAGSRFTWLHTLDEYLPIDSATCAAMTGQELVRVSGTHIIGTPEAAAAAVRLAWVDVINAGDWLIVVLLLEVEVLLQLRDRLTDRLIRGFKTLKGVLYAVLFAAALYWGAVGDYLDFWDAFLWLVAFIFIELNIFQWHAETEEEKAHANAP